MAIDFVLNFVRPPLVSGGDVVIYGVGIGNESNVSMLLLDCVGYMVVIVWICYGKICLVELLII